LSSAVSAKTRFVGYLGPVVDPERVRALRRRLVSDRPLVVGTVGGGEDGYPVLAALVDAYRRWPEHVSSDSVLIGGPLMSPSDRDRLATASAGLRGVRFLDEVDDLPTYLAAADVVVSMAGFNTVCELFAAARPVVLVPRSARGSDQAQRSLILARQRLAVTVPFDKLHLKALLDAVNGLLAGAIKLDAPPPLGGEQGFAAIVDALLSGAWPASSA
jgi:predicted glycosyltransferase